MNYVGHQSRKLAISIYKLEVFRKAKTTMHVKDIAMKPAIANTFSTLQKAQNIVEDFPRVKKLKKRHLMEQRTPDTTTAQVTFLSISWSWILTCFMYNK